MLSQIFLQQLRPFFRAGVMSFHISATLLLDSAAITGKFLSISVLRSIHWSVLLQSEFCFVLRTWRAPHQHLYFWTWRGRGCKVPQILPTQTQSSFNATSAFEASRTASIFPSSEWMPHVFFVCFLFWFWFWFWFVFLGFFLLLFGLFRVAPRAYRRSQAMDRIRATAAHHSHSHRNSGSKPCLQPMPQLMATQDP